MSRSTHGSAGAAHAGLMLLLAAACGSDRPAASDSVGGPASFCPCEIHIAPELALGRGAESYGGVTQGVLDRDSRGRHLHRNHFAMSNLLVFDSSGAFLRTLGRPGAGPGEFSSIVSFFVGRGDTLHIFDQGHSRYSALSPDGRHVRTVPLPYGNAFTSAIELQPGHLVLAAHYETPERSGFPMHHLFSDSLGAPFGGPSRSTEDASPPRARDRRRWLARETDTTFWAARMNAYVLERWHVDGRLLQRFERAPEWFSQAPDGTIEAARNPLIMGVQLDEPDRLWIVLQVRDRRYRDLAEWGPEATPGRRLLLSRTGRLGDLLDGVVEVIDTRDGSVLASRRTELAIAGFAGPGRVYTYAEDSLNVGTITVWRVRLTAASDAER